MKKIYEKKYPIIGGLISSIICWQCNINFIDSENISDALNANITIASIVIGFLGAVLPVILGMRNDSIFVRYVFELDKDKLFLKYIKQTIVSAIGSILISMVLFFRDMYENEVFCQYTFYLWIGSLIYMLLCTYRSVSNMMELIFSSDELIPEYFKPQDPKIEQEIKERKKMFAEESDKI